MKTYLIIGTGRCARHFDHYFDLLGIPHFCWNRNDKPEILESLAEKADRVLLLIRDSAIVDFFESHPFLSSEKSIHFSGVLSHPKIASAHPLMTFGPGLYDFETYKHIPFVCEDGGRWFAELLPELPNPHYYIAREKKPLYHALCSMSGNFTTMLWESVAKKIAAEFKIPSEALAPYLAQTFKNLLAEMSAQPQTQSSETQSVLTGPLQRGDSKTVIQHLDALQGTPEQSLYYAFMNYYFAQNRNRREQNEYLRF